MNVRPTNLRFLFFATSAVLLAAVIVVAAWPVPAACSTVVTTQAPEKTMGKPGFDPQRIAYLEKAGWEAYYARSWPQVFSLMVQMNREQFCMPLPTAIAGAIDIVRASIAFAPVDNDLPAATAHLQAFYEKARRTRDLQTDAKTLAALETDYWIVHRQLAVARKQAPDHAGDITPMVAALARLHTALFTAPPAAIQRSAELRAEAAATVDRITGGYSTDIPGDWQQIEQLLGLAYGSLF
ncbi:MAG: hypothetical protein U0X20_30995 [Caldilineaceae bacterium]